MTGKLRLQWCLSLVFTLCTELWFHEVSGFILWQQKQGSAGRDVDLLCHRQHTETKDVHGDFYSSFKYKVSQTSDGNYHWELHSSSLAECAQQWNEFGQFLGLVISQAPGLWTALVSHWSCAGHSHQLCCQGLHKSNQLCSMSLFWKNLGSDLGCKLTSACSLQSVDVETLLNSCTARVTCMDHLGLSKQTVLWLRACSMWAVLARLSSWGRNQEPVAHMSGEQVNFKSSGAKIMCFFNGENIA